MTHHRSRKLREQQTRQTLKWGDGHQSTSYSNQKTSKTKKKLSKKPEGNRRGLWERFTMLTQLKKNPKNV